jgi:PAS domain S-box-containing protein
MTGAISDIDDKKRMEEELKKLNATLEKKVEDRTRELEKTKELYEDLYNNAPTMYLSVSVEDTMVQECNTTYLQKTGFDKEEVIGKSIFDFYHADSLENAQEVFQQFVENGVIRNKELQLRKKNGEKIDVLMNASAAIDKNGKIIKSRSSFQDISSLKEAEKKIMVLNEQLNRQVEELKQVNIELESFSYSISHDLRSPLRAINGYAFAIREDEEELSEGVSNMLDKIQTNSEKMGNLIDDLLQFSQVGRKKTKPGSFEMNNVVHQVVSELTEQNPQKKYKFLIDDLPKAFGDHAMIRQVLFNLISNAMKYSGREEHPVIQISGVPGPKGMNTYSVKDNGVGFDMKYQHKLFGVFERLHEYDSFEGTGIGLAIVKRVIDRHQGKVWAESEPNKGATFYFSIQAVKNHPS